MNVFYRGIFLVFMSLFSAAALAVNCSNLNMWTTTQIYTGGNQVQHDGNAFQAKWWTQNESPNSGAAVWMSLGICDGNGNGGGGNNGSCDGLPTWLAGTAYTTGQETSLNQTAYRANWWTQGDNPTTNSGPQGSGKPWTIIDDCGSGTDDNISPTANANGPYATMIGNSISLSSSGSADPDGQITNFNWNFGDGTTSTQANPNHTYANVGVFNVSLTVTDDEGANNSSSTTATISNGTPPPPPPSGDKKVIGYFAEWGVYGRNYHVKNLVTSGSAAKLTHIMYAFGNVTNGQCVLGDSYADYDKFYDASNSVDGVADTWDAGALRGSFNQLRKLKQLYPNIKVVWSFGGWTWSGGFAQAAANPQAFANSCYNLIHDPRWDGVFDGIDIDWEYPNSCGLSCDSSGTQAYPALMSALRNRFGNELVTSAITASTAKLNAADYGAAAQYLDFYMLMTYDFFGAFAAQGPTAPHSALNDYPGIPTAGFYSSQAVQSLKSLGVPSSKILMGIGFYGRGWTGVTQGTVGGSASGAAPGTYEAGIEDYKVLKSTCPTTGTVAGTAYAHCGNNWWSYDTPATINGKMNYINQQGLGGAFFWEFSGDTSNGELINAISNGL